MPEKDLSALFLDTLKDIYYFEEQILKALPRMTADVVGAPVDRSCFERASLRLQM